MTIIKTILSVLTGTKRIRKHDFSDGIMIYEMYQCFHCGILVPDLKNIDNMCIEREDDERSRSGFQI